jgi:GGDEF domain-containing protein
MNRGNRSLYLAIAILLASVVIGFYTDLRSSEIQRRQAAIDVRLFRIQTLTEAINGALAHALLEKSTRRLSSYTALDEELSNTINQVRELSNDLRLAPEAERLHEETQRLRHIQQRAATLMSAEQWEPARDILSGESYQHARTVYETSSERAIIALTNELSQRNDIHVQQRIGALWLILVAVGLLLWVGRRHSGRLQNEAREQRRLRDAIVRANQELEQKVQARTAELEQANARLERLSVIDGLSGLANRRKLDEALLTEWGRAQRHRQWLATSIRRAGELAARYGGEEFVLLLPGCDLHTAEREANRVRQAFMEKAIPHACSATAPVVTISLGVAAIVPTHTASAESLLKAADEALYVAKQSGRNRVHCATL